MTLFRLLPYLAPSCPFVVYHEFLEPLLHTFHTLQNYYMPKKKKGGGDNDVDDGKEDDAVGDDDDGNHKNSGKVSINVATTDDMTRRQKEEKTTSMPMMLRHNIPINLCLTDSWFREYQVLEGRTHPNMMMLQNRGYLLTGTKLCPRTGTNKLDEGELRKMRARLRGRRKQLTRHMQKKNNKGGGVGKRKAAEEGKMGNVSKRKK